MKAEVDMHEVSICQSIVSMLGDELPEDQHRSVREIHVRVGVLSNIEPQILSHVFGFVVVDTPFENACLKIESVEVKAECESCHSVFEVRGYKFICPDCGKPTSHVIEGKEMTVHRIVYEKMSAHEEAHE